MSFNLSPLIRARWRHRGRTPAIPGTGQRIGCNISTITNQGQMSVMVCQESFRSAVLLRSLQRFIRQAKRKVFLIWDRHPVHEAAAVGRWLQRHAARIEVFPLPTYIPELNPGEYRNQDAKSNAVRRRPHDKPEMMLGRRTYLRST